MSTFRTLTSNLLRTLTIHGFGWCALWLLMGCHGAERDNAFDPALTPAVELEVALDDTAGTATLTWTQYAGEQPFAAYWVLRKTQGLEAVDTLAFISEVDQTSYVDATLAQNTTYVYRLSVVNAKGFERTTPPHVAEPVAFPTVQILRVDFNSHTATSAIEWTPYSGPDFLSYEVKRRTEELSAQIVFISSDRHTTSFIDSRLDGNTRYHYQIAVQTQRDETVLSAEQSGAFHAFLDTWPLDVEEGDYARLYTETEDRITALIAGPERVRLLIFNAQGDLLEDQVLFNAQEKFPELVIPPLVPQSVNTALDDRGRRVLALSTKAHSWIELFTADGHPIFNEVHPFSAAAIEELVGEELQQFSGQSIWFSVRTVDGNGSVYLDNVSVFGENLLLLEEDFDSGRPEEWSFARPIGGWADDGGGPFFEAGQVSVLSNSDRSSVSSFATKKTGWQVRRLEADFALDKGVSPIMSIGPPTISLHLNPKTQEILLGSGLLNTGIRESDGSVTLHQNQIAQPFPILAGISYRLGLDIAGGTVGASVTSPVFWADAQEDLPVWGSLVAAENLLVLSIDRRYLLTQDSLSTRTLSLDEPVSDIRLWEQGTRRPLVGICLPQSNRILFDQTSISSFAGVPSFKWPDVSLGSTTVVGAGLGHEPGTLFLPLSFGVDARGRFFVLDAGNARIQVFDQDALYITQWGGKGKNEGEFDFGSGQAENFAGSIAVDNDGFIYVADVGNGRIQKFAP